MSGKKIGIMGGTFNPIHNGHLLIAENARWQFGLDQICFLPAGIPPHKQNLMVLDGHSRCAMVQLAIEDNPDFYLSEYEVQRTEPSYTYLTLEYLKQKHPEDELYFIMGADSLRDFATWRNPKRISELCHILVAVRDTLEEESLTTLAKELKQQLGTRIGILNTPNVAFASHEIRMRVNRGQSIRYMVPEKVRAYINDHHFYTTPEISDI